MTTFTEQKSNWVHADGVRLSCGDYTWTEETTAKDRFIGGSKVNCKVLSVVKTNCGYAIDSKGNVLFLY